MRSIKNKYYPLFIFTLLLLGCSGQKRAAEAFKIKDNEAFKQYLTAQNIPFKTLSDTIFNKYYGDFLAYEKKVKLEANPYLKVNKVYIHQVNSTSVEFTVYSDEGTFCINNLNLYVDGINLGKCTNGKVKILKPILIEHFGTFEIIGNIIKSRKRRKTGKNETYYYVEGVVKNDTIRMQSSYIGKAFKFEKKKFAKTYKEDFYEVYQPNLKTEKKVDEFGLINFEITGEFDLDSPVQPDIKFEK